MARRSGGRPARGGARARSSHRSVVMAVLCGSLTLSLAGCRSDHPESSPPTTRLPLPATSAVLGSTGTTSTTLSPDELAKLSDDEQIRHVIDAYWQEFVLVGQQPDLNRRSFFSLVTGDVLASETTTVANLIAPGQARRLPADPKFAHRITRITLQGATASLDECVVDDLVVFVVKDGTVVDDDIRTYRYRTTMTKASGRWQISRRETVEKEAGVQPCATPAKPVGNHGASPCPAQSPTPSVSSSAIAAGLGSTSAGIGGGGVVLSP
jgi:hypothetical protein